MKIIIKPTDKSDSMDDLAWVGVQTKSRHDSATVIVEPAKGTSVEVMAYDSTDHLRSTLIQVAQNINHIKSLRKKS